VAAGAGVDQVDSDLGVLDAACGAGVLALHPDRGGALLQIPGLIDDQHRGVLAEVLDEVVADVITHAVRVPYRTGQQVLHPVRAGIAGVFSERPAVLARQVGQQPQHERPGTAAWFHPAEPPRDPAQQLVQSRLPPGRRYAVACGHRLIFGCRHNTRSSTVAALACSLALPAPDQQDHDLRLEY
jgi:hypothetical protein